MRELSFGGEEAKAAIAACANGEWAYHGMSKADADVIHAAREMIGTNVVFREIESGPESNLPPFEFTPVHKYLRQASMDEGLSQQDFGFV